MQNLTSPTAVLTVFEHQVINETYFVNSDINNKNNDFTWLVAKVESEEMPCFNLAVKSGQVVLMVRHYLSVINLPSGVVLEILPKISSSRSRGNIKESHKLNIKNKRVEEIITTRAWVAQMLLTVYGIKSQNMASLAYSKNINQTSEINKLNQSLWINPLVEQWLSALQNLPLPHHLPRHYNQQNQNKPQAQGKLLIKQQLKHNAHRPHYRYTSQAKFEFNPLWWQFFYTVLIKITNLNVKTEINVSQIINKVMTTQDSAHKLQPLTMERWQDSYNELQQSLEQTQNQQDLQRKNQLSLVLTLGWQILKMCNSHIGSPVFGTELNASVMINMNQMFEKWVTKIVQRQYGSAVKPQPKSVWLKGIANNNISEVSHKTNSDEDKNFEQATVTKNRYLQPDLIIRQPFDSLITDRQHETITTSQHTIDQKESHESKKYQDDSIFVVADVKYKLINQQTDVSSADLYQLFTYCQYWKANHAWLIFPKANNFTKPILLKSQQLNGFEVLLIPFDVKKEALILK